MVALAVAARFHIQVLVVQVLQTKVLQVVPVLLQHLMVLAVVVVPGKLVVGQQMEALLVQVEMVEQFLLQVHQLHTLVAVVAVAGLEHLQVRVELVAVGQALPMVLQLTEPQTQVAVAVELETHLVLEVEQAVQAS